MNCHIIFINLSRMSRNPMKRFILATFIFALTLVSCNQRPDDDPANNPRQPVSLTTKSAEFVQKGAAFNLQFLERIDAASAVDYIVSPLSMQFLLGMILDGGRGETADEICSVLGYGQGEVGAVNEYCLSMLRQLPTLDKKTTLNIANAIFVDDGWPLLDSYKGAVKQYYQAEVSNLDFSNGDASLKAINGWCSQHTNGLVPKILDDVDPNMLAYLLNAMYFKGQWKEKFPKSATTQTLFTTGSGTQKQVPMMKLVKNFGYQSDDIFRAVRLPYGNGAFSMTVFLPQTGHTLKEVVKRLKAIGWSGAESMASSEVDLWLPRFETKYHIKLNDILSQMGMPRSFDPEKADFKAMSAYALYLSFVQQDAVIKVDEEGSEAAVVSSAGMMKETAVGPGNLVIFHADEPFLYVITEASTGAILFAGRYSGD